MPTTTNTERMMARAENQHKEPARISACDGQWRQPRLFAWVATSATVSVIIVSLGLDRGENPYLRGLGVFLLLCSGVLILAPFYFLAKHGKTGDSVSYMQTRMVVDQGLYSFVRHPQYLGYMLLASGFALLSQHWLALPLAIGCVLSFCVQAAEEERVCLTRFGEPYKRYLSVVPRFNIVLGIAHWLRRSLSSPDLHG